jgi:hypothetical protein
MTKDQLPKALYVKVVHDGIDDAPKSALEVTSLKSPRHGSKRCILEALLIVH